jgi:hypothetical protein
LAEYPRAESTEEFIEGWSESGAAERANKDQFLAEMCDAIEVPRPDPTTGDPARGLYVFERDTIQVAEGQKQSIRKIDFYKDGCFLLEAKQGSEAGSPKLGTAKRGTAAWNVAMRDAFDGSWDYRPFPNARTSRCLWRERNATLEGAGTRCGVNGVPRDPAALAGRNTNVLRSLHGEEHHQHSTPRSDSRGAGSKGGSAGTHA